MTAEDAIKVLAVVARHDLTDSIGWRCDGEYAPITIWVNCNDTFAWGCADCEDLTIENLPAFEQAIKDCGAIDPVCGSLTGCDLFVARIRKQRPQGAAYPKDKALWPLFDECGPEREVKLGNPYKPGDYHPETWGKNQSS